MEKTFDVDFSIIFLNYDPENKKDWIDKNKQLIFQASVGFNYEFIEIKNVEGYVNAVNEGFKQAKGKYLIICNDDIEVHDSLWLQKLKTDDGISSFMFQRFYMNGFELPDAACFCLSRETQEKIGLLDQQFAEGYGCDDIDYFFRALELGIPIINAQIHIQHKQNQTYKLYFSSKKEQMTLRNVELFYKKWHNTYVLKQ